MTPFTTPLPDVDPAQLPAHYGRMNDPTASAFLRGQCGDEMEFYLVVAGGTIRDVRFWTDGCEATMACGEFAAQAILGRSIEEALELSAAHVLKSVPGIGPRDKHCAILTIMTLYKALADYLLKP